MGRAACVCRKWRYTIRNPVFWRHACLKSWQVKLLTYEHFPVLFNLLFYTDVSLSFLYFKITGIAENYKILQSNYNGSWKKMWILRPRVRTDGKIYVISQSVTNSGGKRNIIFFCLFCKFFFSFGCFWAKVKCIIFPPLWN